MTTRVSLLESPLFLGFDHFEQTLERLKKSADGYPPYNIEQVGDNGLRITLAVAGFHMDDLDVELENNQLTIRGRKIDEQDERVFHHRGIANRAFSRSFVLADGIEVEGAQMDNGLLHIDMRRIIPEPQVQKITITKSPKNKDIIDIEQDS